MSISSNDSLYRDVLSGRRVLILGGLGFLGSSLALRMAACGARLTLADAMIDEYGGNPYNIAPIRDAVVVNYCDIRDRAAIEWLVRDQDYVFHSAAQVCHLKSLSDPFPDIDINIRGTAVVMEALRRFNPGCKLIKLGSRGQYGSVLKLPADEDERPIPRAMTAAVYSSVFRVKTPGFQSGSLQLAVNCVLKNTSR